jgi:probable phosphoglycerate mutase
MLYLVRHGETEWNVAGRYQGAMDSPLTARGRDQARALGRLLRRLEGDAPFTAAVSPLGRAQETAQLISEQVPLAIATEPRLTEVSIGAWDGMTDFEIEAEYPGALDGATNRDWYFRAPGGEPLDSVIARARDWLNDPGRPTIGVTHGVASRIIRGVYLGLSTREMLALPVPQNGVFQLQYAEARFVAADGA